MNPLFVYVPCVSTRAVRETAPALDTEAVSAPTKSMTIIPDLINSIYEGYVSTLSEKQVKSFNGRLQRGRDLALVGHVSVTEEPGVFYVAGSKIGITYQVDLNNRTCSCPDSQAGFVCKHRFAAWLIQQAVFQAPAPQLESQPAEASTDPETEAAVSFAGRLTGETMVWGIYTDVEQSFPVEILESEGDVFLVRALPEIVGEELRPRFPFPSPFPGSELRWATSSVHREFISQVKIYRK